MMRSLKKPAKLAMLLLLALLLLCNRVGNVLGKTIHENSVDLHALLDFKKGITGPQGALSNWSTTTHFCRWTGVNCTTTPPFRVSSLNLTGQNLQGQITPSLGNLTFLSELDLKANLFGGNIPNALTNCSRLQILSLSSNMLVGSIPRNIGFLSNLLSVDLSRNSLTGNIPPSFKNITHLLGISLANNQLQGSIPEELGQLPEIQQIYLGGNGLFGRIPTTFFNLSVLQVLDLSINRLSGTLPSDFGHMLRNLNYLILSNNTFEGAIPASLGNASQLQNVDLSGNSFIGQIPSYWGNLNYLVYLNLARNKLEARDSQGWEFLSALSTCPDLQALSLDGNQLHGVLPNSIGNLSIMLEQLNLGKNSLFGTVPPIIGKYNNLFSLTLSYNNLTGTIEKWIGTLKNLQGLDLEENNFTGPIPYSIGNLTELASLSLSKNQFDGVMPSTLGNFPLLTKLDLSYNNIEGSIPTQISNLKQLTELQLSSNKLTGEIPNNLDQCDNLITIQMDQNMLIGNIPTSLGNLKALNMLNLSHNNLSGTIPLDLNDLQQLRMLDLSYNHLQGPIPRNGVFEDAAAISLDGNWGLCGGAPNLHMGSCHAGSPKSRRQYYLIRILIPIFGFMSVALLIYFILTERKMRKRKEASLPPFGKQFLTVSHKDLDEATENFSESNLIGKGSYGSVYKGKLSYNKMEIAVKVFDLGMHGAEKSFLAECEAVRNIQHRNLLPIITACSTADTTGKPFKALVYELMPNGNLDTWLHNKGDVKVKNHLDFTKRISITVSIADVLDYLHHDIGRPIIHCDLKPSNILLDHDMTAYLGDFGIARFFRDSRLAPRGESSSIGLRGTIGYIPPEYAGGGHPSTCGDAYSFGVLLLEMFTGKRPTDSIFEDGVTLINFVEKNFPDQIFNVIDISLQEECKAYTTPAKMVTETAIYQCLLSLVQVALSCTPEMPSERMNMREAATRLRGIHASYLAGKDKYSS